MRNLLFIWIDIDETQQYKEYWENMINIYILYHEQPRWQPYHARVSKQQQICNQNTNNKF